MNQTQIALLSVLLLFLPLVPAATNDYSAFLVTSSIGFIIVSYLTYHYRVWKSIKGAINAMYFSGIYSMGIALGVFLSLPFHPKHIAEAGFVFSIPFIVNFLIVALKIIPKFITKDILYLGNGVFLMLLIIVIGALAGRFVHNFYETIVIYSGFIALGVLAYLYVNQGVKH